MKLGTVAYFVLPHSRRTIGWGVVEENYVDGVGLELYEMPDFRLVHGIPIAQYDFNGKRKKLPNGWSWDTDLCGVTFKDTPKEYSKIHLDKPDELLGAIYDGLLVSPSSQQKQAVVEADINQDGYTLLLKYPRDTRINPSHITVREQYLYSSYQDAKLEVDLYERELKRQAELSDYDWSVEQIQHDIARYVQYNKLDKTAMDETLAWFTKQPNVEDIETRFFAGNLEWKYTKNKKWKAFEIA